MSDQDFAVVNGRKWVSQTTADKHVSICSLEFTACLENLEFAPHSVDVVVVSHSGPHVSLGV